MKAGKNAKQIHTLLKALNVSELFVYYVLALYNDTGNIADWPKSRRPRTAHTKKVVEAVRACINQNPVRRQKTITKGASTLCRMAKCNTLQLCRVAKVARHMPSM